MKPTLRFFKSAAVTVIMFTALSPLVGPHVFPALKVSTAEAADANGCDFYAAPNGLSGNNGTTASQAWDLHTALNKTTVVTAGKTLCLNGGIYKGNFTSTLAGSSSGNVTIRSTPGQWAVIDGYVTSNLSADLSIPTPVVDTQGNKTYTSACNIPSGSTFKPGYLIKVDQELMQITGGTDGNFTCTRAQDKTAVATHKKGALLEVYGVGLTVNGAYVAVRDLELTNTYPVRIVGDYYGIDHYRTKGANIAIYAPNSKFVNLVIHDGCGIGFWTPAANSEVSGNIVYNVGQDADNRGHCHSIYTQNAIPTKKINDNIVFNSFGYGIHAYTEGGFIDNLSFDGNVSFNAGHLSRKGPYNTILIGGYKKNNNTVLKSSFTYKGGGASLQYGSNAAVNATLENNYFASGFSCPLCQFATVSGNKFFGSAAGVDPTRWPQNDFSSARPTGVKATVRVNPSQANRANIIIYNWDRKDVVDVEMPAPLATLLANGASYEVRDVQNYLGGAITGVSYANGKLRLPMKGSGDLVAQPIGNAPKPAVHTDKEFNAYVFCIGSCTNPTGTSTPPPDTTAPLVTITSPTTQAAFTTVSNTVHLAGTANDISSITGVTWQNDKGGSGTATGTTNWSVNNITLQAGLNTIKISAKDAAGNTGIVSLLVTYVPPSTTFAVNDRVVTKTDLNVRSGASIKADIKGTVRKDTLGTIRSAAVPEQSGATTYQWWEVAYDNGISGWSAEDGGYLVKYVPPRDTTPPTLSASAPLTVTTNSVTVTGTVSDDKSISTFTSKLGSSAEVDQKSKIQANGTFSFVVSGLQTGVKNTITLTAKDTAGNPTTTVLNVTVQTQTNTVATDLSLEAESTTISTTHIKSNSNASGGKLVSFDVTQDASCNSPYQIKFDITGIDTSKTYYAWGRVLSPDFASDSFCVIVDEGSPDVWDTAEQDWQTGFRWSTVTGRIANNGLVSQKNMLTATTKTFRPIVFNSAKSTHSIIFRHRDKNTGLDKIFLTTNPNQVPQEAVVVVTPPPDTTPPTISSLTVTPNSLTSGSVAVATTASDNSGTVSKVEFYINSTLFATDTTAPFSATHAVDNLSTGTHTITAKVYDPSNNITSSAGVAFNKTLPNFYIEAEKGALVAPLAPLTIEAGYTGTGYVASPTKDSGSVTFTVTVPSAGTYYIHGRVMSKSTTGSDDSFFVSVNGGSEDIWDTMEPGNAWANAWQWRKVGGRGCTNARAGTGCGNPGSVYPKPFSLNVGSNTVTFSVRDANTRLDRIFVTSNPNEIPSDSAVLGAQTYNFGTATLKRGSTGPAVVELQKFLNVSLGLNLPAEGNFGPLTESAVKEWQKVHGLVADGVVGAQTRIAMNASI